MSQFDKLLDELDAIRARRAEARELSDMASGNNAAGREFRKSLAAMTEELTALAPKPRRTIIVARKDAPDGPATIAKAFAMLHRGDLRPDQRGELMLRLSGITDGVLAKAMPSGAERVEPQSARALAAKIKEIEGLLDRHATASHVAAAERILASVQETMAHSEEGMSMGDHGALRIQLSDLKHLIESKKHVQG